MLNINLIIEFTRTKGIKSNVNEKLVAETIIQVYVQTQYQLNANK